MEPEPVGDRTGRFCLREQNGSAQGHKNRQQKEDRSPAAAASAPDEAKKASPTGSRVAECVEATKVYRLKNEESFEGKSSSTTSTTGNICWPCLQRQGYCV